MSHDYFEFPLNYYGADLGLQTGSTSAMKMGRVFSTALPANLSEIHDSVYIVDIRPTGIGEDLVQRMIADPILMHLVDEGLKDFAAGRYDKL